jgi:hypothetical protein
MHFECLVEGRSDKTVLSILLPKIFGTYNNPHTWKIHEHRGIGSLPSDLSAQPNRADQTLLHNLPSKLRAYGKASQDLVVVVLVDLDERPDCRAFKAALQNTLQSCSPAPRTLFRIAIEEVEAWFLGDQDAIKAAYPDAKQSILDQYDQDSQYGTWELLADAIYPGGCSHLQAKGKRSVGALSEKRKWAANITPFMDINANRSPSFKVFRSGLQDNM